MKSKNSFKNIFSVDWRKIDHTKFTGWEDPVSMKKSASPPYHDDSETALRWQYWDDTQVVKRDRQHELRCKLYFSLIKTNQSMDILILSSEVKINAEEHIILTSIEICCWWVSWNNGTKSPIHFILFQNLAPQTQNLPVNIHGKGIIFIPYVAGKYTITSNISKKTLTL